MLLLSMCLCLVVASMRSSPSNRRPFPPCLPSHAAMQASRNSQWGRMDDQPHEDELVEVGRAQICHHLSAKALVDHVSSCSLFPTLPLTAPWPWVSADGHHHLHCRWDAGQAPGSRPTKQQGARSCPRGSAQCSILPCCLGRTNSYGRCCPAHLLQASIVNTSRRRRHAPMPTWDEQKICLGASFYLAATNGFDPTRRINLEGFCQVCEKEGR